MAKALKASKVLALARGGLLDDFNAEQWPDDASLIPALNLAQLALEAKVFSNPNITRMKSWVVVPNVPAGTTDLAPYFAGGKLLELLNAITSMREKQAGTPDENYQRMNRCSDLPTVTQNSYNGQYFWDGNTIKMPGATQALDFRVFGEFSMQEVTTGDSALVPNTGLILAHWTAGIAANARSGGKKIGDPLLAQANGFANQWMNVMIMEMQDEELRQQAFGSGQWNNLW